MLQMLISGEQTRKKYLEIGSDNTLNIKTKQVSIKKIKVFKKLF